MNMHAARGNARLFLCGDVMTGRGVDQILPHPSDPTLHESYVTSASEYVELAERAHGPIGRRRGFEYIWGDALQVLDRMQPCVRVVNLETAVTTSDDAWPGKGIHYRMHPNNVPSLTAARIDCCVLANNHTLDWGRRGLEETLRALHSAGLRTAGAGTDLARACAPAAIEQGGRGRVLVYACGAPDSGVSLEWAATSSRSGVWVLSEYSARAVDQIGARIASEKCAGDIVIVSLHWGGNWGYAVSDEHRRFAQRLVDVAGVDIVYGHSSHHPKPIEVHGGKLILYGCGDLLNDYEGIGGYEQFRPDLSLMYFPEIDPATGGLVELTMVPVQLRRLRLNLADRRSTEALCEVLTRECEPFGTSVQPLANDALRLRWPIR